jgi:hypothetical protein
VSGKVVQEKLIELVGRFGTGLCDDPRRCEALLRDVCGDQQREIFVLVSAARERVGADLLNSSSDIPAEVVFARLAKRLHENLGLAEDVARWGVETWAVALGVAAVGNARLTLECSDVINVSSTDTVLAQTSVPTVSVASSTDEENDVFAEFPRMSPEEMLRQAVRRVLADGIVTDQERAEVNKLRRELGIDSTVASRIVSEVRAEQQGGRLESPSVDESASDSVVAPQANDAPATDTGLVTYTDILLDPRRYVGQTVRVKGRYTGLLSDDGRFFMTDRDGHDIDVYYARLPTEQQRLVLNRRAAEWKRIIVEGPLEEVAENYFAIMATSVEFIKKQSTNKGQSGRMPDWDGSGPCVSCRTLINMKFDNAVCPVCGHRMSWQEAFQACASTPRSLPRSVYSEKDLPERRKSR